MRLSAMNAQWITFPNWSSPDLYAIGLSFKCPHCGKSLSVFFKPHLDPNNLYQKYEWKFTEESVSPLGLCWKRTGDSLENITLEPSIDVAGHWHGNIINGEAISA